MLDQMKRYIGIKIYALTGIIVQFWLLNKRVLRIVARQKSQEWYMIV